MERVTVHTQSGPVDHMNHSSVTAPELSGKQFIKCPNCQLHSTAERTHQLCQQPEQKQTKKLEKENQDLVGELGPDHSALIKLYDCVSQEGLSQRCYFKKMTSCQKARDNVTTEMVI